MTRPSHRARRIELAALALGGAWFALSALQLFLAALRGDPVHRLPTLMPAGLAFVAIGMALRQRNRSPEESRAIELPAEPLGIAKSIAALLGIAAVVLGLYHPALQGGFYQDDWRLFSYAEIVDSIGFARGTWWLFTTRLDMMYRPVAWLLTSLDHAIWGVNPFGFHLSNLGWHILAGWLVFLLGHRLLGSTAAGAVASLLYLLHPLHAEAVIYVTVREESIAACGYLGALLLHIEHRRRWRPHLAALALLSAALALLSKEHAVTLPVTIALLEWVLADSSTRGARRYRSVLPYLALVAAFALARTLVVGGGLGYLEPTGFDPHLDIEIGRLGAQLLSGVPTILLVPFPFPFAEELGGRANYGMVKSAVALVLAFAIGKAALGRGAPWRLLAFASLWPILTILPVATLLQPIDDLARMRYYYLPAVGWAIAVVLLGRAAFRHTATRIALASIVAAYLIWGASIVAPPWFQEGREARRGAIAADSFARETGTVIDSIFVSAAPDAAVKALHYRLRQVASSPAAVAVIDRTLRLRPVDSPFATEEPFFHPASLDAEDRLALWANGDFHDATDEAIAHMARGRAGGVSLPRWSGFELNTDSTLVRGAAEILDGGPGLLSLRTLEEGERPWIELPVDHLPGAAIWSVRIRGSLRYDETAALRDALRANAEDLMWEIVAIEPDGREIAVVFPVRGSDRPQEWVIEIGRSPEWMRIPEIAKLVLNLSGPPQRVTIREIVCLSWPVVG